MDTVESLRERFNKALENEPHINKQIVKEPPRVTRSMFKISFLIGILIIVIYVYKIKYQDNIRQDIQHEVSVDLESSIESNDPLFQKF